VWSAITVNTAFVEVTEAGAPRWAFVSTTPNASLWLARVASSEYVSFVAPGMFTPFRRHWMPTGSEPRNVVEKVTGASSATDWLMGWSRNSTGPTPNATSGPLAKFVRTWSAVSAPS
jgi:hypothetical protein